MLHAVLIALSCLVANMAFADQRAAIHGVWGTAEQCGRAPIKEDGTVLWEPFVIDEEWLRQGQLWCQLSWFPEERRQDRLFTGAFAKCGEDAVRSYLLGMVLEGGALTLRWDVFRSNGPLKRCVEQ